MSRVFFFKQTFILKDSHGGGWELHPCNSGSVFPFQKVLETGTCSGGQDHGLSGER